jgi:hypothetical protein
MNVLPAAARRYQPEDTQPAPGGGILIFPDLLIFLNCSASAVNYPIDFKSVRTVFEDMQETAYVCHYETGGALSDKL